MAALAVFVASSTAVVVAVVAVVVGIGAVVVVAVVVAVAAAKMLHSWRMDVEDIALFGNECFKNEDGVKNNKSRKTKRTSSGYYI